MPNHTETKVRIQGAPHIIDAMYGKLKSLVGDNGHNNNIGFLEQFIGDPSRNLGEVERNLKSENGMPNWYAERLNHWGTKWDVYHVQDVQVDFLPQHAGFEELRVLTCLWNTAWSPCIPAMVTLSRKFNVDITLEYIDEGLFFVGRTTIINGEINLEQDYDGKDVYRGMYELFGREHYFDWLEGIKEFVDDDFKDEIHGDAKNYVSEEDFKKVTHILGMNKVTEEG
jgi:hypothetical protein